MPTLKKVAIITGTVVVVVSLGGWIIGRQLVAQGSPIPDTIGVNEGQFASCPDSPNCVSTQTDSAEHSLNPIAYTAPLNETHTQLLEIVNSLPRTEVSMVTSNYIHAVSRSQMFGFVDDTEIYIDDEAKLIHIRAAARMGYSDMGVNRQRAEEIFQQFEASGQ